MLALGAGERQQDPPRSQLLENWGSFKPRPSALTEAPPVEGVNTKRTQCEDAPFQGGLGFLTPKSRGRARNDADTL